MLIMEKNTNKEGKNDSAGCCHHGHGRYLILRWILGFLILSIAFSMGVKLGEFKAELKSGFYGYPMMRGYNYDRDGYYGMPMMGGYGNYPQNTQVAPKTPTPTKTQ